MSKKKLTGTDIESLLDMLASKDGMIRQKARKSLVALGKPAVSSLIRTLQNSSSDQVRREAPKAFGAISHTRAVPSLAEALEDGDHDVAWLAAEALIKFKMVAWPELLCLLIKRGSHFVLLHRRAHHVLRNQKEVGFNGLLATLRRALESSAVPESTTVAAYNIT